MSKGGKSRRSEERKKKKRGKKEAMKALYRGWADSGENAMSKRHMLRASRVRQIRPVKHRLGPCGNVGCRKCSPLAATLWERTKGLAASFRHTAR